MLEYLKAFLTSFKRSEILVIRGGGGFPPLFSCIDLVMHHTQDITKIRYSQKLNSFFPDMCLEILAMCYLVYSTDLLLLCKLTSLTYGTTTDI